MNLLILACSDRKATYGGPAMRAIDRYDGPAWQVLRKALRERPGLASRLTVLALSAQYGLFRAESPIAVYDRRMTPTAAVELRPEVAQVLAALPAPAAALINVGQVYRLALPEALPWPATWAEGAIGERLSQLKGWLWSI